MVVVCVTEEHKNRPLRRSSLLQTSVNGKGSDLLASSSLLQRTLSREHLASMAEFGAHENREPSPNREVYRAADGGQGSAYPPQSAARARRKLGRGDSKNWFNKSFDQAVLASKSKPQRVMRRQNSVTDFFHSMLTKSKSHLQDIFASKKEKASRRCGGSKETSPFHLPRENSESLGAEAGGRCSTSNEQLSESMKGASPYNSGSVFRGDSQVSPIRILHPTLESQPVNANSDAEPASGRSLRKSSNDKEQMSPILPTSNMERFLMSKALNHNRSLSYNSPGKLLTSPVRGQHNAIVKRSSLSSSAERPTALCERETGDTSSPVTAAARRKQMAQSASLSPSKFKGPRTVVTLSSYDSTDSPEEDGERGDGDRARRSVSSAPAGRLSTCWDGPAYPSLLQAGKRTLVKSNSDTLARLESSSMAYLSSSSPQLMYKASSERGGPGNRSLTQFLASGTKNIGTVMIRVTDYLFLGSVEAAYNEPMLCKYDISSLIDMTNVNPALVPAHKKSDCPCACVANKTPHFRSKLNIGVDDIEWENLEQYFDEINSFINAARRKDRRVLVFSYMGQSRAAAAVVQHLMTHFKMPYEDAMKVVRSKRPQIKLNSGFVKALRRLEKRLGLTPEGDGALKEKFGLGEELERREGSPVVSRGSVEAIEKQSPPHVVRGAWLEC